MKIARNITLVFLFFMGASACSYKGSLQPDFHFPPQYPKIPLSVALVVDKDLEQLRFSYEGDQGIDIQLHPGVANAVKSELAVHFKKVTEIKKPSDVSDEELYAVVEYLIGEAGRNDGSGRRVIQLDFRVSLKGKDDEKVVSTYKQSKVFAFNAPGAGGSGSRGPTGKEMERLLQDQIRVALRAIGNEINSDNGLHRFAGISPDARRFEKARKTSIPGKLGPSKYEEFLDGVVIVKNSNGFGTGFFVSENGLIITSHHVVDSDDRVGITRRSREVLMGRVVARDAIRDLALISVEGGGFPFLRIGTLEDTSIGLDVVAIGTPEGYDWSIAKGIVSAVRENQDGVLEIQTDAALNPGSSGGPLINIQNGRVVGVCAWGLSKNIAEGVNFGISAEEIKTAFPDYFAPPR